MREFETEDVAPAAAQREQGRIEIEGEPEAVAELFEALAKAQGELTDAFKGSRHEKFGTYAEFQDYTAVVRPAFSKNGLSYIQMPVQGEDNVHRVYLQTMVAKGSARLWSIASAPIPHGNSATNELQTLGIALQYLRRYALAAVTGMAATDNNGDVGKTESVPFTAEQFAALSAAAAEGRIGPAFKSLDESAIKAWECPSNAQQITEWRRQSARVKNDAS